MGKPLENHPVVQFLKADLVFADTELRKVGHSSVYTIQQYLKGNTLEIYCSGFPGCLKK